MNELRLASNEGAYASLKLMKHNCYINLPSVGTQPAVTQAVQTLNVTIRYKEIISLAAGLEKRMKQGQKVLF